MNYTVGDGMVALALAGGIVGYLHLKHQQRLRKIDIIHEERMAAMEKGIPLPEFPFEPGPEAHRADPDNVIPILGTVLSSLSVGAMIALYLNLPAATHSMWISPLPFCFLGIGLIGYYFLKGEHGRQR
jgi:hypothetical protein